MAAKTQKWTLEPTARRVRVEFGGKVIADSQHVMLMIESPHDLVYYFPRQDVQMEFLAASDHIKHSGYKGDATFWHVQVGEKHAENAAWTYPNTNENRPDLSQHIGFVWNAMDAWYEEDERVYVHPRNPYHRVDTLKSNRHIQVVVDGVTIADTHQPYLLFETGLPTRYYIPQDDVQMQYLAATDTHTRCPYKGEASYWSIVVSGTTRDDVVWGYVDPIPESPKIKGLFAFYNEKLDIYVDGVLEEKPRTVFS
jgi:uncharacterized protein (DUF427 family)